MRQIDDDSWHERLVGSRLPWNSGSIRPADIAEELCRFLLNRENLLEDVNFQKITPNCFVIEIEQANYTRNYRPLEDRILQQWKDRLLEHVNTTNNRQGRTEYRFAGPIMIDIRPGTGLRGNQARLLCRIGSDSDEDESSVQEKSTACLKTMKGDRSWKLRKGVNTVGRDAGCQVPLDLAEVQQKKLVSGVHAYIIAQSGIFRLFDGSPDGRPSINGTFVNLKGIPRDGVELKDGDHILLAALRPGQPDPDLPGSAALVFQQDCV